MGERWPREFAVGERVCLDMPDANGPGMVRIGRGVVTFVVPERQMVGVRWDGFSFSRSVWAGLLEREGGDG